MTDLIDLLSEFNRKERFFLVSQALGNQGGTEGFTLDLGFRKRLGKVIGVEVPRTALAWMDYHLDWIAASLWAYENPQSIGKAALNADKVATGTQQDIDLLIAFKADGRYRLVLLEAKGYDAWSNEQLCKKAMRLREVFGPDGDKHAGIEPYFCLSSPKPSKNLKTESWPKWMKRGPDGAYCWLELELPPRRRVTRCDSGGKSSEEGNYFCISSKERR